MNNILSIDFDFFYPDPIYYDWGLGERSFELNKILWTFREYNTKIYKPLKSDTMACNDYIANPSKIDTFFDQFEFDESTGLIITDSHADMYAFAQENSIIYNFDQHHDYYNDIDLNCGNWVYHLVMDGRLKIEDYHVIYPSWRINAKDIQLEKLVYDNIHYKTPAMPVFDYVFVFQSSGFTPPWDINCFHLLCDRIKTKLCIS